MELLVSFFHIACSESLHGSYMLDFIQDQGLDVIAEGLDTLKHMAGDMNEVCSNFQVLTIIQFTFFGFHALINCI